MDSANTNLNFCMYVCVIHLLFPLNYIMELFFLSKTNRKQQDVGLNFYNELCLFIIVINWFNDWTKYTGMYNPELWYAYPTMNPGQLYITNLIGFIEDGTYPFDAIMALIAANTWIKLGLKMMITKQFGPLFKVMSKMIVSLFTFMIMWILQLVCFTSISLLLFGTLPAFKSFFDVGVMYFFSSLGNWDTSVYCVEIEYTGEPNE